MQILKKEVNLKIIEVTSFILLKSFFRLYLANSGIRRLAHDVIIMHGNISIGIVIPLISPYLDRASEQELECFSRLNGISICFKVERPERIYEVTATGSDILNIFLKYPSFGMLLRLYFLLSIRYKTYVSENSNIDEIVVLKIKYVQTILRLFDGKAYRKKQVSTTCKIIVSILMLDVFETLLTPVK